MTDRRLDPPRESPEGEPFELPERSGEQMLNLAGFKFQEWLALEAAGLTIDFNAFARPGLPAGERTVYRPQLSAIERGWLDGTKPILTHAVQDASIADSSITDDGRRKITELYSADLQSPLLQRLSQRSLAVRHGEKLQECPVATVTAAFLLMDDDAFRALGANDAFRLPAGIARAFTELDRERRDLPGGSVFSQMLYRGKVRDRARFYDVARERSTAFFDKIIAVIDSIDDNALLEFEQMSGTAAERCRTVVMPKLGILETLREREKSFRSAIIEYAQYMKGGESHFGEITRLADGTYDVIGLGALQGVGLSTDKFLDNEYLKRFFAGVWKVHHLPGVSSSAAEGMHLHHGGGTSEGLRAQGYFQSSIVHEIVILLHKIERHFAPRISEPEHGARERDIAMAKLGIARGVAVELLMISEFFADTVEKNNAVVQGLVAELNTDPETILQDPRKMARLKVFAHLVLENAANLSHARKIVLQLLDGAFGQT